jgi:hypothetical protein
MDRIREEWYYFILLLSLFYLFMARRLSARNSIATLNSLLNHKYEFDLHGAQDISTFSFLL